MTGLTGHQICLKLGSGELDMTLFQFGRLFGELSLEVMMELSFRLPSLKAEARVEGFRRPCVL